MKKIRCAIYTRKSSDEGLEQSFNSLDAQREACAAYVLSQASEGWTLLKDPYDDGGLSGGTLERPALRRLLADIAAGTIDIVVVYKVDRLTRSLLDFSKLIEAFDAAGASFVSITQSFNTTTSMGRLTLNMLLSFAQFEREVTAERIRDKIAASKAKGMWMGGTPPLGYAPDSRTLRIVPDHAVLVRDIFARYLALGNVRLVALALASEGVMTPVRQTANGRRFGGGPFFRGQIYKLLSNPLYVGIIRHRDVDHPAQHEAIIDRKTFDETQQLLSAHVRGERHGTGATSPSPLAGLIVDEAGEPLVAAHACKNKIRYRYYVSRSLQHGGDANSNAGLRIPAREIEGAVIDAIIARLESPLQFLEACGLALEADDVPSITKATQTIAVRLREQRGEVLRSLVAQVKIGQREVKILLSRRALAQRLGLPEPADDAPVSFSVPMRLTRTGRAVRLIQSNGRAASVTAPDPTLVKLLLRARSWWEQLGKGDVTIEQLAAKERVTPSYVSRVVRLAFLAPHIVDAIVAGTQPARLDGKTLIAPHAVSPCWDNQIARFEALAR